MIAKAIIPNAVSPSAARWLPLVSGRSSLSQFIVASTKLIVADGEEFARDAFPEGTVEERRDHIEGMLKAIALDLDKPPGVDLERL